MHSRACGSEAHDSWVVFVAYFTQGMTPTYMAKESCSLFGYTLKEHCCSILQQPLLQKIVKI